MEKHAYSYEVIMVDDGSKDDSWKVIQQLSSSNPHVKGIKFRRNYGKSAGLQAGFEAAQGDVVVTMDADLQDSPEEIPEMRRMIVEDGFDLISGWKKERHDPISKTIPTKLYNAATRLISGIKLHDFNCGLKAYKNNVIKSVEVYGEMHRYIPVLAKMCGFEKIGEKVVQHKAREFGKTKFGLERFINGPLDLLTISFVGRFGKRPMHFFGALGLLFSLVGIGILGFLAYQKLFQGMPAIHDRPLFMFGFLLLIIGSQLFLTGFLAELITRNATDRNKYLISERIGLE